jgi:succinyl-diaminopimelate desuccinylase
MKEKQVLHQMKNEMIHTLREMLSYNTVEAQATEDAPFGQGNKDCLNYTLRKCESMGMSVYNCDNYAGHAELGDGEEVLGILGHLDVVPATEKTWIVPPFSGEIIDNKIYGRGTLDDKGPMVACMYAAKALKEAGYKFKRKVRLIFGCNEETGSKCVKYYFKKMPYPTFSFSPDGNFPVINREKGMLGIEINVGKMPEEVLDFYAGLRRNIVPDECLVTLKGDFEGEICKCVQTEKKDGKIFLTAKGVTAHGSMPEKGENAVWKMARVLHKAFLDNEALSFVVNKMCDYTGAAWGVNISDKESGHITLNIGIARMVQGDLILTIDVRHPITYTCDQVIDLFKKNSEGKSMKITVKVEPLHVPEESFLVQSLIKAYEKATGEKGYSMSIGGGTYSRNCNNCVAFGPEFPGVDAPIHQANECVDIDTFMKMAEIYMQAIKDICCE